MPLLPLTILKSKNSLATLPLDKQGAGGPEIHHIIAKPFTKVNRKIVEFFPAFVKNKIKNLYEGIVKNRGIW
jgi:hypothetical protein